LGRDGDGNSWPITVVKGGKKNREMEKRRGMVAGGGQLYGKNGVGQAFPACLSQNSKKKGETKATAGGRLRGWGDRGERANERANVPLH